MENIKTYARDNIYVNTYMVVLKDDVLVCLRCGHLLVVPVNHGINVFLENNHFTNVLIMYWPSKSEMTSNYKTNHTFY